MPAPSLVIFDFDGTLVDTWDWFAEELLAAVAAIRRRTVSRGELERLRGRGSREVLRTLGVNGLVLPLLAWRMRRRAEAASGTFGMFVGVPELLRDLRSRGVDLALVSSNSRRAVANALGEEVSGLFAARRCGAGLFGKARSFRSILKETGHAASGTVVVGDETRDVEAARDAGVDAIAVEWGFARPEALSCVAPDRTVADPAALRSMLLRRASQAIS